MKEENITKSGEIFNSAINFALDKADGDGLLFLRMWREGDWNGIRHEFPDYEIPVELTSHGK